MTKRKSIYDGLNKEQQKALGMALANQAGIPPKKKAETKKTPQKKK